MAASKDIIFQQGRTFTLALMWETLPVVFKAITAITQTAPIRITAANHGIPEGWRVAVTNVKGMVEVNAEANNIKDKDYFLASVIDVNTVELSGVNAAGYKAYTSGGYIQYNTPVALTGFTARMTVRDKVGGAELLSLTTENGRLVIDGAANTVTLKVTAADTALMAWKTGVYDLELVSADVTPVVTALLGGKVTVTKEVTT